MAGRKKRKKKKGHIFLVTLVLTISVGCAIMFGSWVLWGTDSQTASSIYKEEVSPPIMGETTIYAEKEEIYLSDDLDAVWKDEETSGSAAEAVQTETVQETTAGKYDYLLEDDELCREQNIFFKESASSDEVTIAFAGDILFDDNYAVMATTLQRGQGIAGSISGDLLKEMRSADIFMVNNEFTYTERGEPLPGKTFTFRAKPEYASWLFDMGADIVSLANNHVYDYGEVSLLDTLDTLDGIGMPHVGAGRNLKQAIQPVYFIINDIKIAFLSATQIERMDNPNTRGATENSPGVFRCRYVENLLQAVGEAEKNSDFVIVYIHWGTESTDELDWAQKEQAPKIAEAGADLIIGDHPHVLQPVGYCGDVPVVYSLGNFLFNSKAMDTCLVKAVLDENGLKRLQFVPARQENCSVTMNYGAEKERVLSYMRSISPEVNIDEEGFITRVP